MYVKVILTEYGTINLLKRHTEKIRYFDLRNEPSVDHNYACSMDLLKSQAYQLLADNAGLCLDEDLKLLHNVDGEYYEAGFITTEQEFFGSH